MKKKNVIIGLGAAVAATAAGVVAYKNRDKIKNKVNEVKEKRCAKKEAKKSK